MNTLDSKCWPIAGTTTRLPRKLGRQGKIKYEANTEAAP